MRLEFNKYPLLLLVLLPNFLLWGQGQAFSLVQHEQLANVRVNALIHDLDGIWIGTNKGLYLMQEEHIRSMEALAGEPILSLHKDHQGNLWIGTYEGKIFRMTYGQVNYELDIPREASLYRNTPFLIADVHLDQNNRLWMVSNSSELLLLDIRGRMLNPVSQYGPVNAVWIDERDYKWLATPKGLVVLDEEDRKKTVHFKHTHIYQLIEEKDQVYVLGVRNKRSQIHSYRYSDHSWSKLALPMDLRRSKICGLAFDKDDELWLAAEAFLRRDKEGRWGSLVATGAYPVTCIVADATETRLWLGTAGGGLYSYSRPDRPPLPESIAFQGKPLAIGQPFEVKNLLFKQDDTIIHPDSRSVLQELFELLKAYPHRSLLIEGHTSTGDDPAKLKALSEARARNIYQYLVEKGIEAHRVQTRGYGNTRLKNEENPYSDENKRVEITLKE
ncbi:MAG: OmpA family protein [Bacteroidota bacterium]